MSQEIWNNDNGTLNGDDSGWTTESGRVRYHPPGLQKWKFAMDKVMLGFLRRTDDACCYDDDRLNQHNSISYPGSYQSHVPVLLQNPNPIFGQHGSRVVLLPSKSKQVNEHDAYHTEWEFYGKIPADDYSPCVNRVAIVEHARDR
ncbi:hypothetical protein BELL_0263g00100 [Botrytis elliptica]|uniref:Uncharacterized protein n=1 Tax=Botrytis elliptica TaxID=278938 RepID=A0A4Z1K0F6_9HELO|nr:hypothetical protein BELL_0263g00100 [Botrytis elliptica]